MSLRPRLKISLIVTQKIKVSKDISKFTEKEKTLIMMVIKKKIIYTPNIFLQSICVPCSEDYMSLGLNVFIFI